jgi:hypothetical protein
LRSARSTEPIGPVDPDFVDERLLAPATRLAQRAHVFG